MGSIEFPRPLSYLKEVKSSLYEKSKTGDFIGVCR